MSSFCPRRIDCCLCLTYVLNQVCSIKNIYTYSDVKKAVTELCGGGSGAIYSVKVENKTNTMILYHVRMYFHNKK